MKKIRTTLYIDEKLYNSIKEEAESKGLTINTVIVSKLYDSQIEKRLHHYNVHENHVTVWDGNIKKLVDVYIIKLEANTVRLVCSEDLSSDCTHVNFVKGVPKVIERLKDFRIVD